MKFMAAVSPSTTRTAAAAAALPMFLIQLIVFFAVVVADAAVMMPDGDQCQPILIEMCKDLPYNVTRFPNLVGDESQKDAEVALSSFDPLIHVSCSTHLKFFLCSVYVPMCTDKVPIAIGPCRPLCEDVRRQCEPTLKEFGFPWPVSMDCSKFPLENNHEAMCMKGDKAEESSEGSHDRRIPYESSPPAVRPPVHCGTARGTHIYVNRTGQCVPLCDSNATFSAEEKQIAGTLIFALTCVCCVLAVLCLALLTRHCRATSRVDPLRYPELALLFCTLSCAASAVVYIVGLPERETVSCANYAGASVLVSPGMQHIPCTVVGILLYYFGTAARLWWLILCFGWLISSGRNGDDLINERRLTLHVLAWAVPLAAVIVVLMAQTIHGDPLTGVCLVGAQSPTGLLVFVAGRELALITLSAVALFFGFFGQRRRSEPSSSSTNTSTGLIAACYIPLGCVLVYCFYVQSSAEGTSPPLSSSLVRLGCDLGLGLLAGTSCLGWILFSALRANTSARPDKTAYMAPLHPPSQVSTSRYPPQQHYFNAPL